MIWVSDPALVDQVLMGARGSFPKNKMEIDVFRPLLGNGLLTAQGPVWRQQRQIVAPLFRHEELLRFIPSMNGAAQQMIGRWREGEPGASRAIDGDMSDVTYQVICQTMLPGSALQSGRSIAQLLDDYLEPFTWPIVYGFIGLPKATPFPGKRAMVRAQRALRDRVGRLVVQRRAELSASMSTSAGMSADQAQSNSKARDDLLTRLLGARHFETGEVLSHEQVVDTLLTFVLAGHETTAKALTWALYLLARLPAWQDRLWEEIAQAAQTGPIRAGHIDQLPQLTMFLHEVMRLYPPVPLLTRVSKQDTELGGLALKAGTIVMIPTYAIHRHETLWQDPNKFDPERFAPQAVRARAQFLPFGAGPRICIGSGFAMIELVTLLANFVRAARFGLEAGAADPLPVVRVTLRPKGGVKLKIVMR